MTFSLDQYRRTLAHPLLGESEERSLLARACAGDKKAKETLIQANQRLVMSLALRYFHSGMAGDHDLMDLVQEGNKGLLEAIKRWDASFDVRFSTYATWWVRALVRRAALTQGHSVPRTTREGDLIYVVHKTISYLSARLVRQPTPVEISTASGLSLNLVKSILPMLRPAVSLYAEDDKGRSIEETFPSAHNLEASAETELMRQQLLQALDYLSPKHRQVMLMRYGIAETHAHTYAEIAARLGISRSRVQQIEKQCLTRLREMVKP